jgi:hypothetical protein
MQKPPRKPRSDSKYTAVEYEQIRPFKDSYMKATTRSARIFIFKSRILPAMFNYWKRNGKNPRDAAEGTRWTKVSIRLIKLRSSSLMVLSGIDSLVFK